MTTLRNVTPRSGPLFQIPENWEWILNGFWLTPDNFTINAELVRNNNTNIYCLWDGMGFLSVNQTKAKALAFLKETES